jgi:hypothetical protein
MTGPIRDDFPGAWHHAMHRCAESQNAEAIGAAGRCARRAGRTYTAIDAMLFHGTIETLPTFLIAGTVPFAPVPFPP